MTDKGSPRSYRRLGDVGFDSSMVRMGELVGRTLLLQKVKRNNSRNYGQGAEFTVQELDTRSGELIGRPRRLVSYAVPVIRLRDQLLDGANLDELELVPPLLARVTHEGETYGFEEAE